MGKELGKGGRKEVERERKNGKGEREMSGRRLEGRKGL